MYSVEITSHPHRIDAAQPARTVHPSAWTTAIMEGDTALVLTRLLRLGEHHRFLEQQFADTVEMVSKISGIRVTRQTTATIGMRVGRPEKAMLRHLKPPVHVLFPVGAAGGSARDLLAASKHGSRDHRRGQHDVPFMRAEEALQQVPGMQRSDHPLPELSEVRPGHEARRETCPNCKVDGVTHSSYGYDLKSGMERGAAGRYQRCARKPIKGVRGLSSESKFCEPIEKGALRSKHEIYVYKDGTTRIDLTNAHAHTFPAQRHSRDVEKLSLLGYTEGYPSGASRPASTRYSSSNRKTSSSRRTSPATSSGSRSSPTKSWRPSTNSTGSTT